MAVCVAATDVCVALAFAVWVALAMAVCVARGPRGRSLSVTGHLRNRSLLEAQWQLPGLVLFACNMEPASRCPAAGGSAQVAVIEALHRAPLFVNRHFDTLELDPGYDRAYEWGERLDRINDLYSHNLVRLARVAFVAVATGDTYSIEAP